MTWGDEGWDLDGWVGMQGHNWGSAHSPEHAWWQCLFAEPDDGALTAVVEGASGRIELGRRLSPLLSMLVVRRADREYRFDRIVDLSRQRPELLFPPWTLGMSGAQGEASLEMVRSRSAMVCLGYPNPARAMSFCLNSKTAAARLSVSPGDGAVFELRSEHGRALEFLQSRPVTAVQPVVGAALLPGFGTQPVRLRAACRRPSAPGIVRTD